MAFSCGARSAFKLKEQNYLRSMLSRRQLQGFVGPPMVDRDLLSVLLRFPPAGSIAVFDKLNPKDILLYRPGRFAVAKTINKSSPEVQGFGCSWSQQNPCTRYHTL
jgi:hypothetical protein